MAVGNTMVGVYYSFYRRRFVRQLSRRFFEFARIYVPLTYFLLAFIKRPLTWLQQTSPLEILHRLIWRNNFFRQPTITSVNSQVTLKLRFLNILLGQAYPLGEQGISIWWWKYWFKVYVIRYFFWLILWLLTGKIIPVDMDWLGQYRITEPTQIPLTFLPRIQVLIMLRCRRITPLRLNFYLIRWYSRKLRSHWRYSFFSWELIEHGEHFYWELVFDFSVGSNLILGVERPILINFHLIIYK